MRKKYFMYSFFSSILGQVVTIICGMILPSVLIRVYGSQVNGAISSITQFLSYIALLEGGIGGVARAVLYKPLSTRNTEEISSVMAYIKSFFQKLSFVFILYALFISVNFQTIARNNQFDWFFTFGLAIVISFSTLAEYCFGISYNILLQADQKIYITTLLNTATTFVNTTLACVMAYFGVHIILLKLLWSAGHFVRILVLNIYVKKHYKLIKCAASKNVMPQRWSGLGQHIAYYLHNNTDVAVLTVLVGLSEVSVYSVYSYVVRSINTLVLTFVSNMEAIFGSMLAQKEEKALQNFMSQMEFLVHTIASICFATGMSVILSFVDLYTKGVSDAQYHQPIFAMVLMTAQLITCIRQPYHSLIIAAGHFKQTAFPAYAEAVLNIGLSVILCYRYGMIGVAFGTMISVGYRMIYYIFYLSKNIIDRPVRYAFKRSAVTFATVALGYGASSYVLSFFPSAQNYLQWFGCTIGAFVVCSIIAVCSSLLFYPSEIFYFLNEIKALFKKILLK